MYSVYSVYSVYSMYSMYMYSMYRYSLQGDESGPRPIERLKQKS